MDITSGEFAGTLAAIFGMGGLVGWALFGERFEFANRNWGSVAEWVAAFATLGVGYQAAVIAREGIRHRKHEYEVAERKEREAISARLVSIRLRAKLIDIVAYSFERNTSSMKNRPTAGIFHFIVARAVTRLSGLLNWSETEFSCLRKEHVPVFDLLLFKIETMRDRCSVLIEDVDPNSTELMSETDFEMWAALTPKLRALLADYEQFCQTLEDAWREKLDG